MIISFFELNLHIWNVNLREITFHDLDELTSLHLKECNLPLELRCKQKKKQMPYFFPSKLPKLIIENRSLLDLSGIESSYPLTQVSQIHPVLDNFILN